MTELVKVEFCPVVTFGKKSKRPPIVGIKSLLNMTRLHWSVRMQYARQHRDITMRHLLASGCRKPEPPVHVILTRIGKRDMDFLNYVTGFKGIQDAVADWLGVDDGDNTKATWEFRQEKGDPKVRIQICGLS